jgi:glycosyltransferase involved in cell wall biosynthesis
MKISIVVPVYNEEKNLSLFNENICKVDLFSESELIYVDDHSTDKSWDILKSFEDKSNVHIYRLDKNYPVGYVRAFGVLKAKGEYIASIDADCIPSKNWLTMTKYLKDNVAAIGFPVFPPPEYDYLDQKFKYSGDGKPNSKVHLHGSGVIIRRNILEVAGNYPVDTRVGEDSILFSKFIELGYSINYVDDVQIIHLHKQQNFRSFLKRYYREGLNSTSHITFILFGIIFPLLVIFAIPIMYYVGIPGLFYIFIPIMFLANPSSILKYIRVFHKPTGFYSKVIVFGSIKIVASIAFIAGVWIATLRKITSRFI